MITLLLHGLKPMAKARPRLGQGYVHMPRPYVEWRYDFAMRCRLRFADEHGQLPQPIAKPVAVAIQYRTTTGNMRPDIDNAAGACLDGLQEAGLLANDSQVRRLSVEVVKAKRQDVGITVEIQELAA